jgi:hypothetical protein
MQAQRSSKLTHKVIQLACLALIIIGAINYNDILDEYALYTYHPSSDISSFQSRVSLTSLARAQLYRANPKFDDKVTFNSDCDTQPHELELGCYFKGRIYVLRIGNTSLAPEVDVVSAHELLHAIWAKMLPNERDILTKQLEQVYMSLNDKDLHDRMASYAKTEPGEEGNELHSILGTEYSILTPALEAHYAKYFSARGQIVQQHAAYQSVFDTRRVQLEQELGVIRADKATLNALNRELDSYKSNGQIVSYNALVPRQNQLVDQINSLINTYSQGVNEYNDLSKSLDSQLITDTEAPAR